jgi:hypothetical protein
MKATLPLFLLIWSCAPFLWGADTVILSAEEKKAVVEKADAIQNAFDSGDSDTVIASTHPSLIKLYGSREEFEARTRESMKTLLASKVTPVSRVWGEPTAVYSSGTDEVCFLPKVAVVQMGDKRTRSTAYFVAARTKGTSEWRFLDGTGLRKNPQLLWILFPDLPKDVVLPPSKAELIK